MTGPLRSKKRLLIVANRFYPQVGGAELVTFNVAQELGKHLQVDVITPLRNNDPRCETVGNVRIIRLWNAYNPASRFPYLPGNTLCPSLPARILFGRYDVVHCFPALIRNNLLALGAAWVRRIPVFLTCYDAFDYADLIAKGVSVSDLGTLPMTDRSKYFLSKFKAIFTISERETSLLKAANKNTFLSTVPILIDEHEKEPDVAGFRKKLHIDPNEKIILCLSRVAFIKGQDILVKAIPLFRNEIGKFRVLIVGRTDYEPGYLQEMKAFVKDNGLEENVLFTGSLPREDALAALKACEVHVLPMRFMNSGAVVAETWVSGKPVLQSNMIDPNYVVEGENGFTFNIESPQDLADKIVCLTRNTELREKMGRNGRDLVKRKFLYSHLAEQYMRVYRECAGIDV